ncbi:hypothetical protein [Enterovibrio paralichthyis]|uniref:hypothetical protein n=1 Tax=Enterovibrio paralichthyis TaxID=2853805 RepID=UPI002105D422|nr:hypothetical protein [Enterovibrio paralichthyis]
MQARSFFNPNNRRLFPKPVGFGCVWVLILACFSQPAISAEQNTEATQYGYSNLYGELTPTQVFALMKNMDAMVMLYANREKPELARTLPRRINFVEGYAPEEVFVALNSLADHIDALAKKGGVEPVRRVTRESDKAIPAEVFLLAGACLDTMAATMYKSDPSTPLGDFYSNRSSSRAKTPSHVYALVDLLDRKLTILLGEDDKQDKVGTDGYEDTQTDYR